MMTVLGRVVKVHWTADSKSGTRCDFFWSRSEELGEGGCRQVVTGYGQFGQLWSSVCSEHRREHRYVKFVTLWEVPAELLVERDHVLSGGR